MERALSHANNKDRECKGKFASMALFTVELLNFDEMLEEKLTCLINFLNCEESVLVLVVLLYF